MRGVPAPAPVRRDAGRFAEARVASTLIQTGAVALPGTTNGSASTTIDLPDVVSVGLRQRLGAQWTLLGTFEWSNWSRIGTSNVVQGNGAASPLQGADVTVEGVVVGAYLGAGKLNGFFLQEEDADADADPATSEGVFVFCQTCTGIAEGQRVRAGGTVSEFQGLTEISASAATVTVTDAGDHGAEVTPAAVSLPIAGAIVWALRANGFTGSMSGALVGAACVLLSCAYSLYLQAAAQVAALLGLPMRAALTQIDPRMAIDIAWANLDVAGLAIVALAVVVAIAGVVWATPRR